MVQYFPVITGSLTVNGDIIVSGTSSMSASNSVSSSYAYTASSAVSSSYAYSASSAVNSFSASKAVSSSYADTASFSNDFTVLGNLTVYGTQSIQYITSSQLNVSDNVITVNVASPGVRFGGLSVFDSGSLSSEATASLFWDSQNNHWIYQRESGSSYTGGMLISGPRNAAGLGNELGTTACMLLVGQGGDHLTSSLVYHDSTKTCFYGTSLFISSSGNLGINETSPLSPLVVNYSCAGGRGGEISIINRCGAVNSEAALNFGFGNSTYNLDNGNAQIKALQTSVGEATDIVFSSWNGSNWYERMRILSDGNLTIGPGIETAIPKYLKISRSSVPTYLVDMSTSGTTAGSSWSINKQDTSCAASSWGASSNVSYATATIRMNSSTANSCITFYTSNTNNADPTLKMVLEGDGSVLMTSCTALKLPTGTSAQRPTGQAGMVRMNTTTGQPEWYNTATSTWASFNQNTNSYLIEYLVVGGGGGGGYDNGAGGGAGGFVLDCGLTVSSCTSYSVIVGAGGSATTGVSGHGGSSCFNGIVALGGGGAGGQSNIGDDGGSGGGSMYYPFGASRGGFGTIGQGFEGGCWLSVSSPYIGSGGGGASQRGFDGPSNGMGGAGKPSTLLGNTCYYAGGGNGSGDSPGCQTQSLGGGGIAGNPTGGNANTNSGSGGGGGINGGNLGGNGGSGIVIIRYPGCQRGTGGTICSYCGTTIHVFTSSGTFVA